MNIIHAFIKVKTQYRKEFLANINELVKRSRAEKENISYRLYEDNEQPNTYVIIEEWKSQSSINLHFETSHFKKFGETSKDYLLDPPHIVNYEVSTKK